MPVQSRVAYTVGSLALDAGTVYNEIFIPWQDLFVSGSFGMAGSIAVGQVGASLFGMGFTSTSSTCRIFVTAGLVPQNAASVNSPAAASGALWMYWADTGGAGASATITASVYTIASGSIVAPPASLLGSGCVVAVASAVNNIQATNLFSFNAPGQRNSIFAVRFIRNSKDNADSSQATFVLLGLGIRYAVDSLGT